MSLKLLNDIFSYVIGLILIRSSLGKFAAPRAFLAGVRAYGLLPRPLANAYGLLLMPLEIAVAGALLTGWFRAQAATLCAALLLSFAIAVGTAKRRRQPITCHCFGVGSDEIISWRTLARIGLLLALAIVVWAQSTVIGQTTGAILPFVPVVPDPMPLAIGALLVRILGALYVLTLGSIALAIPEVCSVARQRRMAR